LELPFRWFSSFFIGRIEGKLEGLSCDGAAWDGSGLEGERGGLRGGCLREGEEGRYYFFIYFRRLKNWEWMGEDKGDCLLEDK